jgi:hypothetical protein
MYHISPADHWQQSALPYIGLMMHPISPRARLFSPQRRLMLVWGTAGMAAPALAGATGLNVGSRMASRVRYKLSADFMAPPLVQAVVPWGSTDFQSGSDFSLQADGKVVINSHGLYETVFSSDWEATAEPRTDIDLRQIGMRLQRYQQPDQPVSAHIRLGFVDTPAADTPKMARYLGDIGAVDLPLGAVVAMDISVAPSDVVDIGDMASIAHSRVTDAQIGTAAVNALILQAKVVGPNTVRISFYNPTITAGIHLPAGVIKVAAMSAMNTRGTSGDTWQVLHSASTELFPGDRVYCSVLHKVTGSLLQATRSSYFQIDRLA